MQYKLLSSSLLLSMTPTLVTSRALNSRDTAVSSSSSLHKRGGEWTASFGYREHQPLDGVKTQIKAFYRPEGYYDVVVGFGKAGESEAYLQVDIISNQYWYWEGFTQEKFQRLKGSNYAGLLNPDYLPKLPHNGKPLSTMPDSTLLNLDSIGVRATDWRSVIVKSYEGQTPIVKQAANDHIPARSFLATGAFFRLRVFHEDEKAPVGKGVLGLGFHPHSIIGEERSFFSEIIKSLRRSVITFALPYGGDGILRFGYLGQDDKKSGLKADELQWVPIQGDGKGPYQQFWQARIQFKRKKSDVFHIAAFSTNTPFLELTQEAYQSILDLLKAKSIPYLQNNEGLDTILGIECDKMQVLEGIKWDFGLGYFSRFLAEGERYFPASVQMRHTVPTTQEPLFPEGPAAPTGVKNPEKYCRLNIKFIPKRAKSVLGLPFFHSNFVALERDPKFGGGYPDGHFGWAPLPYDPESSKIKPQSAPSGPSPPKKAGIFDNFKLPGFGATERINLNKEGFLATEDNLKR